MHLDKKISELLYHYDCVIVPEFGGFITNYKPAHFDSRLHLFHPPSKEVSFNKNLTRNDGLLANYLTEADDCTFEEASALIKKNVEDYFTQLNNGGRVEFNRVGIVYRDSDRNLRFQPDPEHNYLKDAFGLEKVFAVPVERSAATPEAAEAPVIPIEKKVEHEPTKTAPAADSRRPRRIAWAAVLMLPLMAYSGWLISSADLSRPKNLTIADFNPFKSKAAIYTPRSEDFLADSANTAEPNDRVVEALGTDDSVAKISFTEPAGEGVFVRVAEPAVVSAPVNTYVATPDILNMRYHVVGGCFKELGNARGWVDELRLRGHNAFILDQHRGLYRVTFGNFERRKQALDALREIKASEMEGAWLLVQ